MWCSCPRRCSRREKSVTHDPSKSRPPLAGEGGGGGAFIGVLLGILLVYTPWAWAGLRPSFHGVGVAVAGGALAGLLVGGGGRARRAMGRDPVFYLGLAFLGFLLLQWMNAGRELYFDVGRQEWRHTLPRWPGWPSAFQRAEAMQMLAWFFPAWVVAMGIRAGGMSRRGLRRLLRVMACNAGALAVFGLAQYASGTRSIYGVQPLKSHFFASFAYGNHAAPYFVLMGALAAGLLYREVFDSREARGDGPVAFRLRHPGRVAALAASLLLCLVGANMGFSRTGVILAGVLGVFVAGHGAMRGWRALSVAGRVNFAALALGVGGCVYFAVAGLGERGIQKEFTLVEAAPGEVRTVWDRIDLELGRRPEFARAAVAVWREQPWFGVGGWGYKHRVAAHVPESLWGMLTTRGWANAHFDLLQFLAEFGVVGLGLLLGALGVMAGAWFAPGRREGSLWRMGTAGLLLVGVFSVVDLPFRCPAILYSWVAVLAALPQVCAAPCAAAAAAAARGAGGRIGWGGGSGTEIFDERGGVPERTRP